MWVYSHTTYTLKGYTRLTHEAIQFEQDAIREVSEEVGDHLLGTHPLQFCQMAPQETPETHQRVCPLYHRSQEGDGLKQQAPYANRRIGRPPRDRMLRTN